MMRRFHRRHGGAAIVEFALVCTIFIAIVLGIFTFGIALYKWNAGVEATRRGARVATLVAVGEAGRPAVLTEMRLVFDDLADSNVVIEYSPNGVGFSTDGCGADPCRFVRVGIIGYSVPGTLFGTTFPMPSFYATYPVEALGAS